MSDAEKSQQLLDILSRIERAVSQGRSLGDNAERMRATIPQIVRWIEAAEMTAPATTTERLKHLKIIFLSDKPIGDMFFNAEPLIAKIIEYTLHPPKTEQLPRKKQSEKKRQTRKKQTKTKVNTGKAPPLKLDTEIVYVKGIGPARAKTLLESGIKTAGDLLYFFPSRYLDRSKISAVNTVRSGDYAVVLGRLHSIKESRPRGHKLHIITAILSDNTGSIYLKWFNQKWLLDKLADYETVIVAGKVGYFDGLQVTVEEFEPVDDREGFSAFGGIIPIYKTPKPLTQKSIRTAVDYCLDNLLSDIVDPLPNEILASSGVMPIREAISAMHRPDILELQAQAEERFSFAELFIMEAGLALKRRRERSQTGTVIKSKGDLRARMRLPFSLTGAQRRVLAEIDKDMAEPYAMSRLLQGDVGSGKTIVALLAVLAAVEAGYQTAFMAPTEILAEQHWRNVALLVTPLGLRCEFLAGSTPASAAKRIIGDCATGRVDILIGTHSLIEDRVKFARLGLVVIDEQHRFGVVQRARLSGKGERPNILVMTATPIPRTLALSVYGDLDLSIIDELPAGRKPIETVWLKETDRRQAYEIIRDRINAGRQAFFVYPLVEESEKMALKSATEMANHLGKNIFKEFDVGLVHGKMPTAEKDEVMSRFREGDTQILVATTVIEVGIDIKNATIMVIENAERFGLSQLHQLRGRIGRGEHSSVCILLTTDKITPEAKSRLDTMVATSDGFKIAEVDFKLRGPGELMGTRQSGIPDAALKALLERPDLLSKARNLAFDLVERNPELAGKEYAQLKNAIQTKYAVKLGLAETF